MTIADSLIQLLGHSMACDPLYSAMKRLCMNMNPEGTVDINGNVFDAISYSSERNLLFRLHDYTRYRGWYGEPLSRVNTNANGEFFLAEVDFEPDNNATRKREAIGLPYCLMLGDKSDAVIAKLGRQPYEKSAHVSYGHAWWFRFDEHRVLTALNPDHALLWVRVVRLTLDEKRLLRLKADLRKQNRHLNPENAAKIEALTAHLPTANWSARNQTGDGAFTSEVLGAVNALLGTFIAEAAASVRNKSAAGIYAAAKKAVLALNRFARKHRRVIETVEREELASFINQIVRDTGLALDNGIDITEEWRQW